MFVNSPSIPSQPTSLTGTSYGDFWCAFCMRIQHLRCIQLFCANPPYPNYRPGPDRGWGYLPGRGRYRTPGVVNGYEVSLWDRDNHRGIHGLHYTGVIPGVLDSNGGIQGHVESQSLTQRMHVLDGHEFGPSIGLVNAH